MICNQTHPLSETTLPIPHLCSSLSLTLHSHLLVLEGVSGPGRHRSSSATGAALAAQRSVPAISAQTASRSTHPYASSQFPCPTPQPSSARRLSLVPLPPSRPNRSCRRPSRSLNLRAIQQFSMSCTGRHTSRGRGNNSRHTSRGGGGDDLGERRDDSLGRGTIGARGGTSLGRGRSDRTPFPISHMSLDIDDESDDGYTEQSHLDSIASDVGSCSTRSELVPGNLWFHKPMVVKQVNESIKNHYVDPWLSWTETADVVKDHWFNSFRASFTWKPEIENLVRENYDQKGQQRLKDLVSKAGKAKKMPKWMLENVYKRFKAKRLDKEFQKRSKQASDNKKLGSKEGDKVEPGHRNGSISTLEIAERMARKNKGKLPTAPDLFLMAHSKATPEGEREVMGEKAKKTLINVMKKMEEYKEQGVDKSDDEIFYDVVGGRRKGVVYGLGNSMNLYFDKCKSRST